MSALIQLLQRGGLLVGGALVIGLLNLVYDGEQWTKSGATPLFSMMLRYLVPLLAGIWLIVLVWQLVKGWRYLERVRRANAGCRENPVIYRILPRADTTPTVSDAMMFWNQVSDLLVHGQHVAWEITGNAPTLTAPDVYSAQVIVGQIVADWPGTVVQRVELDPVAVPISKEQS